MWRRVDYSCSCLRGLGIGTRDNSNGVCEQGMFAALRKQFIDKNINLNFNNAKIVKEKLSFVHGYSSEQTQKDM